MMDEASKEQPLPVVTDGAPILDLVLADLKRHPALRVDIDLVSEELTERSTVGTERYGTKLRAHNGRDAFLDARQEALDLCMYLRQCIEEGQHDVEGMYYDALGMVCRMAATLRWRKRTC